MTEPHAARTKRLAFIVCGHSQWDDAVYTWLCDHRGLFESDALVSSNLDSWDYLSAIGACVACGCVASVDFKHCPDGQVFLDADFDGPELVRRLARLAKVED